MIKVIIAILLALAFAAFCYLVIGPESYVLLKVGEHAFQATILVGLLILFIIIVILRLVWWLVAGLLLGNWIRGWRAESREMNHQSALQNYVTGNWSKSYKSMLKLANQRENPEPYLVMAARSGMALGKYQEVDRILDNGMQAFPKDAYQFQLEQAKNALTQGQYQIADQILAELYSQRQEPQVLELRLRTCDVNSGEYPELIRSAMKRHKVPGLVALAEQTLATFLARKLIAADTPHQQWITWSEWLTPNLLMDTALVLAVANQIAKEDPAAAEKLVLKAYGQADNDLLLDAVVDNNQLPAKSRIKHLLSVKKHSTSPVQVDQAISRIAITSNDDKLKAKYAANVSETIDSEASESENEESGAPLKTG